MEAKLLQIDSVILDLVKKIGSLNQELNKIHMEREIILNEIKSGNTVLPDIKIIKEVNTKPLFKDVLEKNKEEIIPLDKFTNGSDGFTKVERCLL